MAMADTIARLSVWLGIDTAAFEKGADISEKRLKKMEREFTKLGDKLQDIGKTMSVAITAPIAGIGAAVVKMSGDFESSMIKLSISSQATADELRQMNKLALQLGKDTIFGASDAANAMDELAKSGLSARQILDGAATAAVNLATATGSELSPAANAITDTIQQFGLSTSQLPDAVNQITGAVNQSKLDFEDYALAIGQAGGVAGGLGVEFKDFNATIAATSSLFASGSDAGTSFKTFLTSLAGNSKQAKEAIAQFGLQFYDANGGLRSMAEIAEELRTKLGGLNEQAKTEVLKQIFGTDAMRTAIGLMAQGAEGLDRVAAAIEKTDAAAQSAQRMKGFYGQLENLKGAIETLAIRIGQSGVLEAITVLVTKIADFVDWLSTASPGVLQFAAVVGTLAAAIGPVILAIGAMTSAFSPLLVIVTTRLIPAFALFKLELAALAVAGGPAAVAMRVLAVALRGLLIATGIGLAITALAGAVYLLTRRTNESVPATKAYSQALNTAEQTAKDAQVASQRLSTAMGEERKAALNAATAQRALAEQRLRAAQTRLLQAEFEAKATAAEARRTANLASGGGPGEGVQGRISPSQHRFNEARRAAETADANAKAAEASVIKLQRAKFDLDQSIKAATAPINLPAVSASPDGSIAAARDQVRSLGREAGVTNSALQDLLDTLFPEEERGREFAANLTRLKSELDKGTISADRYSAAIDRLWKNYLGIKAQEVPDVSVLSGEKSIEELNKEAIDRLPDAFSTLASQAEYTKVRVVKSFKDMADDTLSALNRLSSAIQGGGFLDILQGIIGLGLQLGSIGAFGRKIQGNINRVPGNANGTSFWGGGLTWVGERGPELVDLPRGARVTPNNDIKGMRGGDKYYLSGNLLTPEFWSIIQSGNVQAANAGAQGGVARMQYSQSRRWR